MENNTPTAGIFIPTMNRVNFVIRQLRYYANVNCPHTIYVGDSSPREESQKIEQEIKRLGDKIKTKYFYLPEHTSWQAHNYLIQKIEEKYACYSGDDDYQIPNSISECIQFLEDNRDYTSASGLAVSFRLKQHGVYGELLRLADYPRRQVEDNTASDRILKFFDNYYVTHFSVNRTDGMKKYWQSSENITDNSFGAEILPTSLPLIYGKSKIIDCLGFVRQIHDQHYGALNMYDWLTSKNWYDSYTKFETILAEHLAKADSIYTGEATQTVRKAFWSYLQKHLAREYSYLYAPKTKRPIIKKAIRSLRSAIVTMAPSIKYLYRIHIKPMLYHKKELNFEAMQSGSRYYDDFKKVLDSFTQKQT